jgi:hypothetical protein
MYKAPQGGGNITCFEISSFEKTSSDFLCPLTPWRFTTFLDQKLQIFHPLIICEWIKGLLLVAKMAIFFTKSWQVIYFKCQQL